MFKSLRALFRPPVKGGLFFALAAFLVAACASESSPREPGPVTTVVTPSAQQAVVTTAPAAPKPILLPNDDGPHAALTEWWYYNGHLQDANGEQFGFVAVVFKRQPQRDRAGYVAHVAITDAQQKAFQFSEALTVSTEPQTTGSGFRVQVGSTLLSGSGGQDSIEAATDSYSFKLALEALKPAVLQSERGYISVSSNELSYYYSRTRMRTQGTLTRRGASVPVTGLAWMDHQWGDFSLEGDGGWDWFSLQLDDGSDLMLSLIRDGDKKQVLAYGSLVDLSGGKIHLAASQFRVQPTGSWTSPTTGGVYPMGWRISLPAYALELAVQPVLNNQEMVTWSSVGRAYWEGQVAVSGTREGNAARGRGYVELTGYVPLVTGGRP